MKNTNPENSIQAFTRQSGFFSIGVGLGLSAIFALFGATLTPEQDINQASSQLELQVLAANSQSLQINTDFDVGQHQF